jgi:hypothetical protein
MRDKRAVYLITDWKGKLIATSTNSKELQRKYGKGRYRMFRYTNPELVRVFGEAKTGNAALRGKRWMMARLSS